MIFIDERPIELKAYYSGRNSIGDDGEVYFTLAERHEYYTDAARKAFKDGVRDIRGELRLNADTEWDQE
jgi:hypothetical protein